MRQRNGHLALERDSDPAAGWVRLAVPLDVLERLIGSGAVCAAEIRCLDTESKDAVQRLCLERCARCLRPLDAYLTTPFGTLRERPETSGNGREEQRRSCCTLDAHQGPIGPDTIR